MNVTIGAEVVFSKELFESALFNLPQEADTDFRRACGDEALASLQAWEERGIMPFALTATRYVSDIDGVPISVTSVFSMREQGRLKWSACAEIAGRKLFGQYFQLPNGIGLFRAAEDVGDAVRRDMDAIAAKALGHFIWLNTALESIRYTAVESRISRQESRHTGLPRQSWTITVRPVGSRSVPSMRDQFADVVRAAHAVRGHLRTDRKGQKTIRVRPHIRGKGSLVQLKDYALADGFAPGGEA